MSTTQDLKKQLMEDYHKTFRDSPFINPGAMEVWISSALSKMEAGVREEMILHVENEIHDDEDNPDVAVINIKAYLESLKEKKI